MQSQPFTECGLFLAAAFVVDRPAIVTEVLQCDPQKRASILVVAMQQGVLFNNHIFPMDFVFSALESISENENSNIDIVGCSVCSQYGDRRFFRNACCDRVVCAGCHDHVQQEICPVCRAAIISVALQEQSDVTRAQMVAQALLTNRNDQSFAQNRNLIISDSKQARLQ